MDWDKYFEMLIDWKKLPAYKAEPRVDSLIGYYLNSLITDILKIPIEEIIPEFPLRLGTIHPKHNGTTYADRSYKVDFLAIGKNGINYLVEFKTDHASLRPKQDDYLIKSVDLGSEKIINGAIDISRVSTFKTKYDHLKQKLVDFELIDSDLKYTGKNPLCEIIYVIPANNENKENVIDFKDIADWFERKPELDSFEKPFVRVLRHWHKENFKQEI
jgi:hypothetical protein